MQRFLRHQQQLIRQLKFQVLILELSELLHILNQENVKFISECFKLDQYKYVILFQLLQN